MPGCDAGSRVYRHTPRRYTNFGHHFYACVGQRAACVSAGSDGSAVAGTGRWFLEKHAGEMSQPPNPNSWDAESLEHGRAHVIADDANGTVSENKRRAACVRRAAKPVRMI